MNDNDLVKQMKRVLTAVGVLLALARDVGSMALAVILTGMGRDGAEGMKEVRDVGGYTIVQDRSTSVVYGTARFAVELNFVTYPTRMQHCLSDSLTLPELASGSALKARERRSAPEIAREVNEPRRCASGQATPSR